MVKTIVTIMAFVLPIAVGYMLGYNKGYEQGVAHGYDTTMATVDKSCSNIYK